MLTPITWLGNVSVVHIDVSTVHMGALMYPARVFALHSSSTDRKGRGTPASHGALAAGRRSGAPPKEHAMPPRPALLGTVLAASLILASACTTSSAAPAPAAERAVPVRSAPVERGTVAAPVRAAGTVHPKDERALAFKVGGVVARVAVSAGDRVRRGQVLAELDATEVAAGAEQAREGLAKAERDRERTRTLAEQDVVPRALAEDADTAARVARAGLAAAEFNLRRAVLIAPDDGWVDERLVEPGEVVAPGRPVLRVSGRGRGYVVRASLADRDVLGLRPGQPARVTIDALPGAPLTGIVTEIARSASRATGTYEVEVKLAPADARGRLDLLGGLTAKVEFDRDVEVAAAVPIAALVDTDADGARAAVFAPEGGRARRVPVRVAGLQGERAVLAEPLAGVAQVITEGAAQLADGALIHLVP
jgi:RND family efflux transporter MFP subunit